MEKPVRDWFHKIMPYIAVVVMQVGLAGMDVLSKIALNKGMSNYVLVVYRHAVATAVVGPFALYFDRKKRPKMTSSILIKLLFLGLLEPVIDQNLYFLGMKYTTATFAAAIINIVPAITFIMAWIMRLEHVRIRSPRSQGKIAGTAATVAGAMIMTLVKGPALNLFGSSTTTSVRQPTGNIDIHNAITGALMISIGCFSWASFMILQTITLKSYPVELSLTAWICLFGTIESGVLALIMERGNAAAWAVGWDSKLLAAVYSGVVCSGLAYYIQGLVLKERGPVFVAAFNPLCMVIVAVMSSIILFEEMFLGRVIGAVIIVGGLYLVMWGKNNDYECSSSKNGDNQEITLPEQHIAERVDTSKQLSLEDIP